MNRKISEILRTAAADLWDGTGLIAPSNERMTCLLADVEDNKNGGYSDRVFDFLYNDMGASVGYGIDEYSESESYRQDLQAQRYAWLMFAADVAEEWNM